MSYPSVENVKTIVTSGTTAQIEWTWPTHTNSGYILSAIITYKQAGFTISSENIVYQSSGNSKTDLTWLDSSAKYDVTIRTGYTDPATQFTYMSPDITTAFSTLVIQNLVSIPSYKSARLTWNAPVSGPAAVSGYTLKYSSGSVIGTTTDTIYDLSALDVFASYTIEVIPYSSYLSNTYYGYPSSITFITTNTTANNLQVPNAGLSYNYAYITWDPPLNNAGDVSYYKIVYGVMGSELTETTSNITGYTNQTMSTVLSGLTGNTHYTFTLVSYSSSNVIIGTSALIAFMTQYSPVTNVAISNVGKTTATIGWSDSNNFASYKVINQENGNVLATTPTPYAELTGLMANQSYTLYIEGYTSSGIRSAASATTTFSTRSAVPDAPTNLDIQIWNSATTVSFKAPAYEGDSNIISYTAILTDTTANPDIEVGTLTIDPSTAINGTFAAPFTGLLNGRSFLFSVTANNNDGSSAPATTEVTLPPNVPEAPRNLNVTAGSRSAIITFDAPFNGGSSITSYTVSIYGEGQQILDANTTTATFTDLWNGQTYTFSVIATNDQGSSTPATLELLLPYVAPPPAPGGVPCFPAGVKIRTPGGEIPVETLKTGDLVLTAAGRAVPIRMHSYDLEETTPATAPYFIPAGALGPKAPAKPLHLSPLHAFQVRPNVWWCAKEAAKHSPKVQQYGLGSPITYYHVECPNFLRDNLVADGVVVESFAAKQLTKTEKHNLYKFSKALGGFVRSNPTATLKY